MFDKMMSGVAETTSEHTGGMSAWGIWIPVEEEDFGVVYEIEEEGVGIKQWAIVDGMYHAVGDTAGRMPKGMYDIALTPEGLFFIPLQARLDDIIRFPDAVTDEVVTEIETFWEREEIFREYGMPYKRGILLYGPPGSGKSTTLLLIARDVIERDGMVLVFDPNTFVPAYRQIRMVQPDTKIVVFMEDLDALLERKESVTLNMLDGAEDLQRVVFVATTNYPEKLGPRVQNRPSRFDRRFKIPHPSPIARQMYLEKVVSAGSAKIDIERYVRDSDGFSLAHLKELFVATVLIGAPYEKAVASLREMIEETASSVYDTTDPATVRRGQYA